MCRPAGLPPLPGRWPGVGVGQRIMALHLAPMWQAGQHPSSISLSTLATHPPTTRLSNHLSPPVASPAAPPGCIAPGVPGRSDHCAFDITHPVTTDESWRPRSGEACTLRKGASWPKVWLREASGIHRWRHGGLRASEIGDSKELRVTLRGVWRAGSGGQGREQAGQCWAVIKSESSVLWQGVTLFGFGV